VSRRLLLVAALCLAGVPAQAEPPVDGPWLGISYQSGRDGVLVLEVHEDTAASDAGLRRGDEIVELGGSVVFPNTDLPSMVSRYRVGERLMMSILRAGRRFEAVAVLGARPTDGELLHRRLVDKPAPDVDVVRAGGRDAVDLAALRGRPAVLAFFSTRCEGCGNALNRLGELVGPSAPRTTVLAIAAEPADAFAVFLQRSPLTVPVALDESGDTARRYTVPTVEPRLFIAALDARGVIRYAAVIVPGDDEALAELAVAVERIARASARLR